MDTEVTDRRIHRVRPFEKTQLTSIGDLPTTPIPKAVGHLGTKVRDIMRSSVKPITNTGVVIDL